MKLPWIMPHISFSREDGFHMGVAFAWGDYEGGMSFEFPGKQVLVIAISNIKDDRELIFDCDWGIGYYPNAHRWKAPASSKGYFL